MLEQARLYKAQIQDKYMDTIDDPKYLYYHFNDCVHEIEFYDNDWGRMHYASVNSEGEVLGFFSCRIIRQSRNIEDLSIVRFDNDSNVFAIDLMRFFDLLFLSRNFNKINFEVVVGNPIETMYDKFVANYGGKVIGTKEKETVLRDGKYYDTKLYEIMREQYCDHRKKNKRSAS